MWLRLGFYARGVTAKKPSARIRENFLWIAKLISHPGRSFRDDVGDTKFQFHVMQLTKTPHEPVCNF